MVGQPSVTVEQPLLHKVCLASRQGERDPEVSGTSWLESRAVSLVETLGYRDRKSWYRLPCMEPHYQMKKARCRNPPSFGNTFNVVT